jgi:hypothetical protein
MIWIGAEQKNLECSIHFMQTTKWILSSIDLRPSEARSQLNPTHASRL